MKNFRTYNLALDLYKDIRTQHFNQPVKGQLIRAALSIPLNLAEGSAKPTSKDRRKFYRIALGSLRETQCLLELENQTRLMKKADRVAAHLYRLCIKT